MFTQVDLGPNTAPTVSVSGSVIAVELNTNAAGRKVRGWPVGTIVRGRRVMWDGEILGPAGGRPIRFGEALERESGAEAGG